MPLAGIDSTALAVFPAASLAQPSATSLSFTALWPSEGDWVILRHQPIADLCCSPGERLSRYQTVGFRLLMAAVESEKIMLCSLSPSLASKAFREWYPIWRIPQRQRLLCWWKCRPAQPTDLHAGCSPSPAGTRGWRVGRPPPYRCCHYSATI